MQTKKRDGDEEVNLLNVYVGIKVDNFDTGTEMHISFKSFTTLEKMNYQIGIVGQEPYTIYKDLEEEKYSYVAPNGNVFMPSGNLPYVPSNHLAKVTNVRSFREIIRKLIAKFGDIMDLDEKTARAIASYKKIEDDMQKAEELGKKPMARLSDLQIQQSLNMTLYCLAFGNPLEMHEDEKVYYREMTDEEIVERDTSEKIARDSRNQFKIIDGNHEERYKR